MIYQSINIGTTANDGTGDSLRTAFGKINNNMATLWSASLPSGPDGAIQYRGTATLTDIAYLGGVWVTVGATERILSSVDLGSWSSVTTPATTSARSIVTDGTQWITVGDLGLIMTSSDGATWTVQTSGTTQNLTSIATDGTYLVAVGDAGTILRSTDGVTWVTIPSPVTVDLNAIEYNVTLAAWTIVGDTGTIISSTNTTSWNESVSGTTANLNSVANYLNTVVIAGDTGTILASQDLVNWGVRTSGTTAALYGITTVVWGTTILAFAVGAAGTIVTSSDAGFITWNTTDYPSITTATLTGVVTGNGMVIATGTGGTLITADGNNTWTDAGIPIGIEGDSSLVFDPTASLLSIDADIIPQTSNTWSLGNSTNRFEQAFFGGAGVTISGVALNANTDTLKIVSAANASTLVNLQAADIVSDTLSSNTVTATTVTVVDITSTGNAQLATLTATDGNIANLTAGNLTVANLAVATLSVANLTVDTVTANTATFQNTVTAAAFFGDGSGLTGIVSKAAGPITGLQWADANLDFAASSNLTFDDTTSTLTTGNITATTVTATQFVGDGSSLTGLPVTSIVAGTNVTVTNLLGAWTISATGGNGNVTANPSHVPLNSIQIAGTDGTFNSASTFIFDPVSSNVTLTGNMLATEFFGNVTGTTASFTTVSADTVIANVTGNLTGDVTGNLTGGNVTAQNGSFTGNLTAGNITITGNIALNAQAANSANLGNIRIWRSNIHEFGAGNDDFVIDTERANLVIQGANSQILDANARSVMIRGGNVVGNAVGGQVTVVSGSGGMAGTAGNLDLLGGTGGTGGTGGHGGSIKIQGGSSGTGGVGGSISIISGVTIGDPTTIRGSNVYIQPGNTVNEDAGTLTLQGANAVGAALFGGNVRITAGTGSQANGNIWIGNTRWPNDQGINNQVLVTDGVGSARWSPINANVPVSLTISNIVNGTSNVSIVNPSGNVTVGVNGSPNVLTISDTLVSADKFRANTFALGNTAFTACSTTWHKLQTSTAAPLQVLIQLPAGIQTSTDFKIITYDIPASNRQSTMITSVTYGSQTSYSEYARTVINTVIADFTVDQQGGNIRLLVSPRVAHLINYTIIVSTY